MSEINLKDSNQAICKKHFADLVCDEFTMSIFSGGQTAADEKLASLDITGYAKKRNNVLDFEAWDTAAKEKGVRLIYLPI